MQSHIKDIQIDLQYKNQNVRGRKALNKGQSLILCTINYSQHLGASSRNFYLTLGASANLLSDVNQ